MINTQRLIDTAAACGIPLTGEQAERFDLYAALLVEWNGKMNLTAITDPREMEIKHFVDSLTALDSLPPPREEGEGPRLIDVGTGAGFPGVALKIMRPDLRLTLLDSLNKRLTFLKELCTALRIEAEFLHDGRRRSDAGKGGGRPTTWRRPGRWPRCRCCANTACRW